MSLVPRFGQVSIATRHSYWAVVVSVTVTVGASVSVAVTVSV